MKDIIFLGLLVLGGFWFFNFLKTNPDFFPYLNVSKLQDMKVEDLKKINNSKFSKYVYTNN
jgi:hypothetical protein